MEFTHLHVQSAYSLLGSTIPIEELVKTAKEKGLKSIALADRNVMYGVIPFYKACRKAGLKPVIGLMADVLHGEKAYPLLLLATSNEGYTNLLKISSSIQTKSKQGLPLKWLKGYSKGLIGISPGKDGLIETLLASGEMEQATEAMETFLSIFSVDRFYLSIQRNEGELPYERDLLDISERNNIPLVATSPAYCLQQEEGLALSVMRCIAEGTKLENASEKNGSWHFQDTDEMLELFRDFPDALSNTIAIADQCNVEIEFHQRLLPKYPAEQPAEELLVQVCEEGFRRRYENPPAEYKKRLAYELAVINKMNFSDYFLIVWDFIKFARQKGILTGPGRGSAAGSMVAYVLEITDIDPMEHHLLFERFLNPERVTMPDIDIDFSDVRRDEVIAYVARKYGELHVAQIVTFGTFAAKAALRDTGRVFGLNSAELEQLSKMIPSRLGITISAALKESAKLKQYYEDNKKNKQLIDTALRLEGLPRHTSTHAAGVVISDLPLTEKIAIQEGHDGVHLTQFPMEALEELGLLKMDFLGLRNLTLMERVLQSIKSKTGKAFNIKQIPMNDKKTLNMLGEGETAGIFQFESAGMQKVLKQLRPDKFADLVAVNALYRPGPMENIPTYIKRRHGEERVTYLHPDLKAILGNTYGIIVYQEQIMQIASKFAGFSLGQADLLRRAVSKKKAEVLKEQRHHFVSGCIRQGYDEQLASQIYDYIVKFANYGFNLSHAAAYSFIAYQLAYLKAHFPEFFMAALMSSVLGNDSKMAQYARELKKLGIELLPPSINESVYPFKSEKGGIRFSLAAIKGVGGMAVKEILEVRKEKRFTDLFDFCIRAHSKAVNRKTIEALIHSGAFDEWGEDRATLLASLDMAIDHAELVANDDLFKDTGFDLKPKYIVKEPIPMESKLLKEKEALGFHLSGHPVSPFKELISYYGAVPLYDIPQAPSRKQAVFSYIMEARTIRTKKGEVMAFLTLSDESGEMEAVVFPGVYRHHMVELVKGNVLLLQGHGEERNDKNQFIIQQVYSIDSLLEMKKTYQETVYIRIPREIHSKDKLQRLKVVIRKYPGNNRVKIFTETNQRTVQLPMWDWINATEACIEEIKTLTGEENVILKSF